MLTRKVLICLGLFSFATFFLGLLVGTKHQQLSYISNGFYQLGDGILSGYSDEPIKAVQNEFKSKNNNKKAKSKIIASIGEPIKNNVTNSTNEITASTDHIIKERPIKTNLTQTTNEVIMFQDHPVNGGPIPDLDSSLIIFGKVQKTGSTTLTFLLAQFLKTKGYSVHRFTRGPMLYKGENEWLTSAAQTLKLGPRPTFVSRFLYYMDFKEVGQEVGIDLGPVTLSMIRNPIDRFISFYNYIRFTAVEWGQKMFDWEFKSHFKSYEHWRDQNINECLEKNRFDCQMNSTHQQGMYYILSHYCGIQPWCLTQSNTSALWSAIDHIESAYVVVGTLERLDDTVTLISDRVEGLEEFKKYYNKLKDAGHTQRNPGQKTTLTPKSEAILRKELSLDLQLYEYVNKRMDVQLQQMDQNV